MVQLNRMPRLAMLVVGLLATQAKADLVDDLRSGRSDIKAAPRNVFEVLNRSLLARVVDGQ